MADLPDGVEILFDQFDGQSDATSDSESSDEAAPRDFHREAYPAYQPPHMRGHNVQAGDKTVNFKNRKPGAGPDPDKVEGVDNNAYQRLKLPVGFALPREKLDKLKKEFPGVFFHCRDNGNHDHPYSHVVTQIGTRMLQRRIQPGARILDVYGNPRACDSFNASQGQAALPKVAKALVKRFGAADFIREVNKWGPFTDDEGNERYHRGTLRSLVNSGEIANYDVLQFVHTLYYEDMQVICDALHAPGGKRVAYGLIHRHPLSSGTINDGEQSYVKNGKGLVKQVNLKTNSTYVHPDITPLMFSEHKQWFPASKLATRTMAGDEPLQGLTWECHIINDDTWVIEMVPYTLYDEEDDAVDFDAAWALDEEVSEGFDTPSSSDEGSAVQITDSEVIIPTRDGKFLRLSICSKDLFNQLRVTCVGKDRNQKLVDELVHQANHAIFPSKLYPGKEGVKCPQDRIFDHVIAAWVADAEREDKVLEAVSMLRPMLVKHARGLKLGSKLQDLCFRDLLDCLRSMVSAGRDINRVIKSKDKIDMALATVQGYVD
jgi:hypothetical protein